jgi:hypothetical protein
MMTATEGWKKSTEINQPPLHLKSNDNQKSKTKKIWIADIRVNLEPINETYIQCRARRISLTRSAVDLEVRIWRAGSELEALGHALGGGLAGLLQKWPWMFRAMDLSVNSKVYLMVYSDMSCTGSRSILVALQPNSKGKVEGQPKIERSLGSMACGSAAIIMMSIPIDVN